MQPTAFFTTNPETKIELIFKQQIGPNNNIRLRGKDSYTFDSINDFNKGLEAVHNMLCDHIERFYSATRAQLNTFLMSQADKEEIRLFNCLKFEVSIYGKINGKPINETFKKFNNFLSFTQKHGITSHASVVNILKYTEEASETLLFYPEREPQQICRMI